MSANNTGRIPFRSSSVEVSLRRSRIPQCDFLRAHEKTGPGESTLFELSGKPIEPIRREPRASKLTVPKAASAREVGAQ
ncbi:unnamed protein product [Protopolystoma xenopodis]|uniref:Uncharacterized protein n=1 Tax=Protopolystoma xenopodis TaxID=117903 RepID=A0A3S4ZVP8_9PLAT|nr:unnamed protein product [Protopolystoma xenopodis]